jgi:hypothetical protein
MVPVEPTAGSAASYSAVQLVRGPRAAHCPSWARGRWCPAEHAARCRSCGVADGIVNQVGPSGTAHGRSELVKATLLAEVDLAVTTPLLAGQSGLLHGRVAEQVLSPRT